MWRHWNLRMLLIGIKNSVAALENHLKVPQKVKYYNCHMTDNVTPNYIPIMCPYKNLYTGFHSSIIHNMQKWKPKCPLTEEWIKKI